MWVQVHAESSGQNKDFLFNTNKSAASVQFISLHIMALLKSVSADADSPAARHRRPSSTCAEAQSSRRRHRRRFLHRWKRGAAEPRAGCSSLNLFDPAAPSTHARTRTHRVHLMCVHSRFKKSRSHFKYFSLTNKKSISRVKSQLVLLLCSIKGMSTYSRSNI